MEMTCKTPARHIDKHIWQRDKDQARSGIHFHSIAETCRENDQSRHDRHKGVKTANSCALTGKRVIFAHITSEDLHCSNAKTQCEKCLIHGFRYHIFKPCLCNRVQIRHKIKLHAFCCTLQCNTVHRENNNQNQQRAHHDLAYFFQSVLQSPAAHKKSQYHGKYHPERHLSRICEQIRKYCRSIVRSHAGLEFAF